MLLRLASLALLALAAAAADPVTVASPDGTVQAVLQDDGGVLRYRIRVDGREVLAPSELGIVSNGADLGRDIALGAVERREVDTTYRRFGPTAQARHHAREATVAIRGPAGEALVDVQVADGGVGVRLRLPALPGRTITADRSTWRPAGDGPAWATLLDYCYEKPYTASRLSRLGKATYGLPLTTQIGGVYLTFTEAALRDYGDLAIRRVEDGAFTGVLHADPQGWTTDDPVVQPWRVTVVARDLTALVTTSLVQDLNPPPAPELADAAWIHPGRATWQWMAIGAPQSADQEQWVEWTARLGYEWYLVDDGWKDWPRAWERLGEVCALAKAKGVGIWLWVHSKEVKDEPERLAYFARAAALGIVGVKVDFPAATNRWWSTWYHDTARDAARHRLLIDFHGATKPTGMERTWPNELTREGVRGHEWHITRYDRVLDPAHDTILPFTRYVAGPGDYTPTVFDPQELQGNTWAHEIAQAVVFTSPFLSFGGHPRDFLAHPAVDLLKALPAAWDETRVLPPSEPGRIAVLARRAGHAWFLAALNGASGATITVPLEFLGPGTWTATRLGDVLGQDAACARSDGPATAADRLTIAMPGRGGYVAWFRRSP